MKTYKYLVTFSSGHCTYVDTNGFKSAAILASAIALQSGRDTEISRIETMDHDGVLEGPVMLILTKI